MKRIATIIFGLALVLIPLTQVSAIDLGGGMLTNTGRESGYCAATETTLSETLGYVVRAALSLVGVIFMALMVYAGYLWMTARGEEAQIEKSQAIIKSAVIGLIITAGAYSITRFVVPAILERTTGQQPSTSSGSGSTTHLCSWSLSVPNSPGGASGSSSDTSVTASCTSCMAECNRRAASLGGSVQRGQCVLDGTACN